MPVTLKIFPQPRSRSSLYYPAGLANRAMPLRMCLLSEPHTEVKSVQSDLVWRKLVLLKRNPIANTSFCQHFLVMGQHTSPCYVCVRRRVFLLGLGNKDSNLSLMVNSHFPSCKQSLLSPAVIQPIHNNHNQIPSGRGTVKPVSFG